MKATLIRGISVSVAIAIAALLFVFLAPPQAQAQCVGICINIRSQSSGGGSGGGGYTIPSADASDAVVINDGVTCTESRTVSVKLTGEEYAAYMVSEDPGFQGAPWINYLPDQTTDVWTQENGRVKQIKRLDWEFVSDKYETKTLYLRFRSRTLNVSKTYSGTIEYKEDCDGDGTDGTDGTEGVVYPRYIRTQSFPTVYYVPNSTERRPFLHAKDYFTHQTTFSVVEYVDHDTELNQFTLKTPMVPKPGVVLVKLPGDPRVYWVDSNSDNPYKPILRWIINEPVAAANFGAGWQQYILEIDPVQFPSYVMGNTIFALEKFDTSALTPVDQLGEGLRGSSVSATGFFSRTFQFISDTIRRIF